MNSRTMREYLILIPMTLGIEYLLCLVIQWVFQVRELWGGALLLLVWLYAFRVANFLIRSIVLAATFMMMKNRRIEAAVAEFYSYDLPLVGQLAKDTDDAVTAFAMLAAKPETSSDLRQFLLLSVAELNCLRQPGRYLQFFLTTYIIDAALERYRRERNASGARPS